MLKRLFVPFAVLVFVVSSVGQKVPDESLLRFEKFVNERLGADRIPGISVGFIKGEQVWAKGFGYADIENKSPATKDSMYRLASVTKPMTAAAILLLAEQGKLSLDDEVQKHVPYFPKKKYPVTIRYLLGHIGGISHYRNYAVEGHIREPKNTKESIAIFQDWELVAEPGTRFNYTSYGYNLLGAVIEGASGLSYGDYMRKHIWNPLGMKTIVMDDPRRIVPGRVRGYEIENGRLANSEFVNISSRFAAGGTRASVIDMLRFGKGISEGKILSEESRKFMFDSMVTKKGERTFYGAGIGVSPINGRFTLAHSGSQQETATHLFIFPSRKLVIAVAANLEGTNRIQFVSRLFELVTGEKWNVSPYGMDPADRALMRAAFIAGRSNYERFGSARVKPEEFRNLVSTTLKGIASDREGAVSKINSEYMKPGSTLERIGSYMATRLAESKGEAVLRQYSNTGSIAFFADFLALPDGLVFRDDMGFAKRVNEYQESWSVANNTAGNAFEINAETNIAELGDRFKKMFEGKKVYPDHTGVISSAVQSFAAQGNILQAAAAAKLGAELYPMSDETNRNYGVLLLLAGQKEPAMNYFRKALNIDEAGAASASGLIGVALDLFQIELYPQGLALLMAADELHPSNANILYRIGEYYRIAGNKQKAMEYLNKAIRVNPDHRGAQSSLKKLKPDDRP